MATKLILDTDIGTDVDDAWALALCLASPEIELLGVTLVHADLQMRAKVALKMLRLAGRDQVSVYKGISEPLTPGARIYWGGHGGAGTDFSDVEGLEAPEGAVEFILDAARSLKGDLIICPIGPLSNIAAAIRRDPDAMRSVKRLVIMGSTFEGEGEQAAAVEHNIRVDTDAARTVFESGIPATVVGLNVTTRVVVREHDLAQMEGSPLGGYLARMTREYYKKIGRDFTWMHDPLAVASLLDPEVICTQPMKARPLEQGKIAYTRDPNGPLDVAVEVDACRFENLLLSRIYELTQRGD